MISEYDPMCEQETGKPPKCTRCHNYMNRIETVSYSWNDRNLQWEEFDDSMIYECNDCNIVIDIE